MTIPLLQTKLFVPPARPALVPRPRLLAVLDAGLFRRMTLISAPAGWGKTTLVSAWLAGLDRPAAWLSLDEGDSDPSRFLTYLVAAVRTIAPALGEGVMGMLQSAQPLSTEVILTALLNEISALPDRVVLVLDDYHRVDAPPVDSALAFMLEHLPSQMHLVVVTREDPPLPLARLRARGHLTEVRAAALRFTAAEAAAFLNGIMGLALSEADVAALEGRTEGWIAGLQLAALSLQGHQDVRAFIQAFTGDHRYIVDYLVEEVLERQPETVRSFLLQTSILDRLHGPLCDAVTGQAGGSMRLEALERGNYFVVPLDERRHWYRYHHLFSEVLQAHLRAEQPQHIPSLHQRASRWYEQQGLVAEAVHHALAAQDFTRAADLIEGAMPAMLMSRREVQLLGWLKALPNELLRVRPVLNVGYVGTSMMCGEFEGAQERLRDAERWLHKSAESLTLPGTPSVEPVIIDEEEFQRLPALIAQYRAALALAQGNVADAVRYARQVLDFVPETDHLMRGRAAAILGLASWTSGDLDEAHEMYAEGMAHLQMVGSISDVIGGAVTLADIRMTQGRLRDAMRTYERGLALATAPGVPVLRGAADMHAGMSALLSERGDLQAAGQHLRLSGELGEHMGLPKHPYRWRVAMARLREVTGDLNGALALLQEAEPLYMSDFSPNVRPVAALIARVWTAQGKLGEALGWAREQALSADDELSYLREFEHITLARVLLAQYKRERAARSLHATTGLLERLLKAAEEGGRTGSVIEILVLQALAHQVQGNLPAALVPLARALTLAEPEGYVRLFVDEGPPMAVLLEAALKKGVAPSYVRRLLAAFGKPENSVPVKQPLIEPLSDRELEVLRLLGTYLDGPDIARELQVSLNTLRTHTRHIYDKLGVTNRQDAVRQAEELNLL